MERLKRSFRNSFRRKKSTNHQIESSKPHQWDSDEAAVRTGNCSFPVKYLGCVQVEDSRGMHICEQALLTLKARKNKSLRGQLYVSGDGLRVVDDETKGLVVDQTIERVSFCAPDRDHERGFSYICRDGTTRRWMCHGFLATKDTGDRLSHAVGCSFAVCLERKQKQMANQSNNTSSANNNSTINSSQNLSSSKSDLDASRQQQFNRTGSFRRLPIKQRMKDPQEAKIIEPVPVKEVVNPYAIERPHATPQLLERQGSCRIFKGLNKNSPFKRQLSLRFSTPGQLERSRLHSSQQQTQDSMFNKFDSFDSSSNVEASVGSSRSQHRFIENFNDQPTQTNNDLSAMCKYLTDNLTLMSNKKNLLDDYKIKSNIATSSIQASTPDSSLTDHSSIEHKTIIDVSHSTSLFNNCDNSSKSSSPISTAPARDAKKDAKLKFGQLSSYSDDFFLASNGYETQTTINKPNAVMFTDLDEPFEVNFNNHMTKFAVESTGDASSSMNSLSNSLTSSLNGEIVQQNRQSTNQVKMMNKLNNAMNCVNRSNSPLMANSAVAMNANMNRIKNNLSTNNSRNALTAKTVSTAVATTNNNTIINKKVNEKDMFDPFNSEWVSEMTKNDDLGRSTNPFLQNLGTVKTFELKM